MDLTPYLSQLREDLTAAASAGDDQTRRTAAVLGGALEPAARLAIMTALSDLAAEVTASLDDRVVEVRLDGRDVRVAVSSPSGGESCATGPHASDTRTAGPHTSGPHSSGPHSSGPHTSGPHSSGPHTAGPRGHAPPPPHGPPPPHEPGPPPFGDAGGDIRRMTLRLIDQVKTQAERAAAEQGVSLNAWVSQAVAGALRGEPWNDSRWSPGDRRSDNRVQGWVQG